jgi:coenzyme F420-reducing hydrogenase delta subunit
METSLMKTDKVLVFTCNWNAYRALESAGLQHRTYSAAILPLKVMCLGRLNPGIILKAFEQGAAGVLLLGCPQGECHYEFGDRRAEEMFAVARKLVQLLGYSDKRFQMERIAVGDGATWVEKIQSFTVGLNGNREAS